MPPRYKKQKTPETNDWKIGTSDKERGTISPTDKASKELLDSEDF